MSLRERRSGPIERLRATASAALRLRPLSRNHGSPAAAKLLHVEESPAWIETPELTLETCRAAFDSASAYTVGVEEELMIVSPTTFDLEPVNEQVLAALGESNWFQRELRASQIEIVTPVCATAGEIHGALAHARRRLLDATESKWRVIAAGTHPFARDFGAVSTRERYRQIDDEYRWAARRSIICGLHVHVGVGDADRALGVYNALRSYLPEVAAAAANSPFFEGKDTELCSIRLKLGEALPRTGVPPHFADWQEFVSYVSWGRSGGLFPDSSYFWWDLRPHPKHGTIELRIADAQTRAEDAAAIAALVQSLVAWLGARFDAGERLPVHRSHRIRENTWRALRYGVRGHLVDLDTGRREPARDRLARLLDAIGPTAEALGNGHELTTLGSLLAGNGADRQRYVAEREGMRGLLAWLAAETAAVRDVEPAPEPLRG